MKPKFSVIIPTYNRSSDLKRALESVLTQTYEKLEIIVVDNYSTDNTDNTVQGFNDSRIKLVKIKNYGVIAKSRNLGVSHAQGKYIAFLDSDDWWLPKKLEESLKYLDKGADIIYHPLYIIGEVGKKFTWFKKQSRILKKPVFENLLIGGNLLANSSVVVKKNILEEIGGLSEAEDLIAIEDFDAWLRIAEITDKFSFIDETLGYYWIGKENISNPERTLVNVKAFEKRYFNELNKLDNNNELWWINYSKGRSYYLLGKYGKSKNYLDNIRFKSLPLTVLMKVLWMTIIIKYLQQQV